MSEVTAAAVEADDEVAEVTAAAAALKADDDETDVTAAAAAAAAMELDNKWAEVTTARGDNSRVSGGSRRRVNGLQQL